MLLAARLLVINWPRAARRPGLSSNQGATFLFTGSLPLPGSMRHTLAHSKQLEEILYINK